jgi:class III poly(R)-hydroxyalkanoic acid synthase PhaE subunit
MNDPELNRLLEKLERARREYSGMVNDLLETPVGARRGATTSADDWSQPLGDWWQANRGETHREVARFFEQLVEHARILLRLASRLDIPKGRSTPNPNEELVTLLEELQRSLTTGVGGKPLDGTDLFSPMSQLMASWRRHAGSLFGISDDPLAAISRLPKSVNPGELRESLGKLLNPGAMTVPSLDESLTTELVDALVDYQRQFNRFARLVVQAAVSALSRMKETAAEEEKPEDRGIRQLYSDWLDCCERDYDDLARDDDFADALCALINGAVRVRSVRQRLMDKTAAAMGMPTHREVRELARTLHHTRRQMKRLEHAQQRGLGAAVQADAATASAEAVEQPSGERVPRPTTRKKSTTRKTAAKKSTSRKKTTGKKVSVKKSATGKPVAVDDSTSNAS